jgi:guanylate kinase
MAGKLFIISAPSGAGKSSLVERVIDHISCYYPIARVITYTSKTARLSEQDGLDYHFVSEVEFKDKIEQGFFMEWSLAYGYYYGSPWTVIDEIEGGHSYILVVDRIGAEKIIQQYEKAVLIWIYTKNLEVLRERLIKRNAENEDQIEHRLNCARHEIEQELRCPLYRYHVLNDDFARAVRKVGKIILHELFHEGLY